MIRLDLTPEPRWIDLLDGVRINILPCLSPILAAARSDDALLQLRVDASEEERGLAFAKGVAVAAILQWEGVGDEDGNPLPVTPEGVRALLDLYPAFLAFQTKYLTPSLSLEAEKKASVSSPHGSSAEVPATAEGAISSTAPDAQGVPAS